MKIWFAIIIIVFTIALCKIKVDENLESQKAKVKTVVCKRCFKEILVKEVELILEEKSQ